MKMIVSNQIKGIDWNAKGTQRITQNVLNLINTYKYEIAYNRVLGISSKLVDAPTAYTMQQINSEVMELISRFEPRATVQEVRCDVDIDGNIILEVVIDL